MYERLVALSSAGASLALSLSLSPYRLKLAPTSSGLVLGRVDGVWAGGKYPMYPMGRDSPPTKGSSVGNPEIPDQSPTAPPPVRLLYES